MASVNVGVWRHAIGGSPFWLLVKETVRVSPRLASLSAALGVVASVMPTAFSLAAGEDDAPLGLG